MLLHSIIIIAQKKPSVQVIARPQKDKILLRWAVDAPYAWSKANKYGFWIQRKVILRNGNPVDEASVKINKKPIKPKPLAEWELLAKKNYNAAVVAQSIYGKNFNVTNNSENTAISRITAVNEELEQRFTFGLLAAEQSFEASLLAGWAFKDITAKPNERYLYTVSVAVPINEDLAITENTVFVGIDMYQELPKPVGVVASFEEGIANVSWNFGLLQNLYTSYDIERSSDGEKFKKLNKYPIFSAQKTKENQNPILFYRDTIPNNITFYYRVKGRTAFNEQGPVSKTISGKAQKSIKGTPHITFKEIPNPNTVILHWKFPEASNKLITNFELRRSNRNQGKFITVVKNIPITDRKIIHKGLKRINYFVIVAKGKNGAESTSFPVIVQPIDSIPPKPPIGIEGTVDTTGVVSLKWLPNAEDDLLGYRIYSSHNPTGEFTQITPTVVKNTYYKDTIESKNLNKKIYYKFQAEDDRHNISSFSKTLILDKPDLIPPSPPVFKNYKVTDKGILLQWIPSTSKDVVTHILYRKKITSGNDKWLNLVEISNMEQPLFTDTNIEQGISYKYTIIAKDDVGNESKPISPISVTTKVQRIDLENIQLFTEVNRETKQIYVSWNIKKADKERIVNYRLYRGTQKKAMQLYKILSRNTKSFIDTDIEIGSNYLYGIQLVVKGGLPSKIKKVSVEY